MESISDTEKETPETSVVRWNYGISGSVFVTIAEEKGDSQIFFLTFLEKIGIVIIRIITNNWKQSCIYILFNCFPDGEINQMSRHTELYLPAML